MEKYDSLHALNDHHKDNHPPLYCDICNKKCSKANTLVQHLYVHLAKKYDCQHCDETFKFKSKVKQHMYIHVGETKLNCTYCESKFIRKSDLTALLPAHTGTKGKFLCCNKEVADKWYLNSHYKTHSEELKYPCSKCDRHFKFNEQRKCHLNNDH